MMIRAGGTAAVHFDTSVGGEDTAAESVSAVIYRNELVTAIVPTITQTATSHYIVSFSVPSNWLGYDKASVAFTTLYQSATMTCTKEAGVVAAAGIDDLQEINIDRILDLLEADETYDRTTGKAIKLLRGTNVVLLEKDVVGSTCVDSVRLTE